MKATKMNEVRTQDSSSLPKNYKLEIVWFNVTIYIILHLSALYGLYRAINSAKWLTVIFSYYLAYTSGLGITAGAHRLWSHRAYKAKLPLRILLVVFHTLAHQNSVITWARDHRVHHKFSETNADPYNRSRGFFFAHAGWLMCKKHPDVTSKGREVDLSDLTNDPILVFQREYFYYLMPTICVVIPTLVPVYCWGETWLDSWFVAVALRYVYSLNTTWLVNSAAHTWGNRPYDKNIRPSQNLAVSILTNGEGWHNYHHVFPWDYKAEELGNYTVNGTTAFLDVMAYIGWAYDLKVVSADMVKRRIQRTGGGETKSVWGLEDKDMLKEEMIMAYGFNKKHS